METFNEAWAGIQEFFGELGKHLGNALSIIFDKIIKLILFLVLSVFFIPSFLIVQTFNKKWNEYLKDLFGL